MPPATHPADRSRAASSSCRCCRRRRRPREASHQILIGQLGNRDWYLLSERRSPTPPAADRSPSNQARQKARQPASPRPRTRSSNPVPSSSESGELPYCRSRLVPISSNASPNCRPITWPRLPARTWPRSGVRRRYRLGLRDAPPDRVFRTVRLYRDRHDVQCCRPSLCFPRAPTANLPAFESGA